MPRRVRHRPWILASAVALASGLAAAEETAKPYPACDKVPTDGDVAAAKGAFQAGNASFNEADYERAINYWEDAYRRDCTAHPNLLNLARAYELNNQKLHAATALETFLARSPGAADDNQLKRRIAKLREQPQADATAASLPEPASATNPIVPVTEPSPQSVPETPRESSKRSFVPLIVAGVGGAVAVTGVVLWAGARSDYSEVEDECGGHDCTGRSDLTSKGNDATKRMKVGGWVAGAGGVVLAGGLVWYFLQKPETTTAQLPRGFAAHVTPSFGPTYGGLEFAGRF